MRKTPISVVVTGALMIAMAFSACKKKEVPATVEKPYSDKVYSIISQAFMDSLTKKGMVLNSGKTPPSVSNIFLVSPCRLLSPYGPDDLWQTGKIINDYKYKIYDQNGDEVKIDYKQLNSTDTGMGLGAYISGSGNKFSIFSQLNGSDGTVTYTHVAVISGELTTDGIKDFQYGFILVSKDGDVNNSYIPVGASRIWEDEDKLAVTSPSFKLNNIQHTALSMFSTK